MTDIPTRQPVTGRKVQVNLRLEPKSIAQLNALAAAWNTSQAAIVAHAIEMLHRAWAAEPTPKKG